MTNPKRSKRAPPRHKPAILFADIETTPILAHVWGIWQQNVALNQIERDWSILSFAAKWKGDDAVIYHDTSKAKSFNDDRRLLYELWKLLDKADVVVTQNGIKFDKKKIFARFAIHDMQPPSTFRMIDTLKIAKKTFGFTSNRLEYLADKLNIEYKKLKHEEFAGFELWRQCIAGNPAAWRAMKKYNTHDVLSLEELYNRLLPWDDSISFDVYHPDGEYACKCGSDDIAKRGYYYTNVGKYQRYVCRDCGTWTRGRTNLFDAETRKKLRVPTPR